MTTRLNNRLTTRIHEIQTAIERERAYLLRPGTSADAIARGGTKLVALTDELRTLQELAREAETRDPRDLAIHIAGALASLYARTAARPEAVHLTDFASDMARMVRDLLEDASA
jgi:hypothetical protein